MSIKTPHDLIFQEYLSNLNVAKDLIEVYLPEKIRKCCDLSSLKVEPTSFVEEHLAKHQADVLYSLRINGEKGL